MFSFMFKTIDEAPNLSLSLEGEVEVEKPSILSYEKYVEQERKKLLKEQIHKFLQKEFPNPYNPFSHIQLTDVRRQGYDHCIENLVKYLTEKYENTTS